MTEEWQAGPGWVVPETQEPWLQWGFGTRHARPVEPISFLHQVHGNRVIPVSETGFAGEGDALTTQAPGVPLGIKTADCVPVLLVDTNTRAIAAIHAGWRGTAQEVVPAAIQAMKRLYGTNPIHLTAAIGPAIGVCCYEVGPEVSRELGRFDQTLEGRTQKCNVDLCRINAMQLQDAGVLDSSIVRNTRCTCCQPDDFWSFRRERGQAGRMWSVVQVRAGFSRS